MASLKLINLTNKLQAWMKDEALPLCVNAGLNPETGAVYERLLSDGNPDLESDYRTRVQARQIYVFASAQENKWFLKSLPIVANIVNFLNVSAKGQNANAGYVHLLNKKRDIADAKLDLYDFAFFVLAAIYRYKVFNDLNALHAANQLMEQIDLEFKGPSAGWMEGNYPCNVRRQNPHMHLFEAFIACYKATKDGKWLARAGEVFSLFETVFYDHEKGVLLEYFDNDWRPLTFEQGQTVEPGHMFEWVWLLHQYRELTGAPVAKYCDKLYENACKNGVDKTSGLIFDELDLNGTALKTTKRCWPVTEYIKASLSQAQECKHSVQDKSRFEENAAKGIELLFEFYFSKVIKGAYVDQLSSENTVIANHAPASTLYHIMAATVEAANYLKA